MRIYTATPIQKSSKEKNPVYSPGSPVNFTNKVLDLQRKIGNRAVAQLLQRSQNGVSVDRTAFTRTFIQRDDTPDPQDGTQVIPPHKDPLTAPGGPIDTGDKGVQCGWVNGKFQCGLDIGKGDPLQLPGNWPASGGSPGTAVPNGGKAATCPGQYARAFDQCCPSGTHVSDNGALCVKDKEPELTISPAPPEQKGDFPNVPPGPDEAYS